MLAVITSDRTQVSADALASDERPHYWISHFHIARQRGKKKRGEGFHTLTRCSNSFHTIPCQIAFERHAMTISIFVAAIGYQVSVTHINHIYEPAFAHILYVCISCS